MKELSIEEKAKAYDEALGRAKLLNNGNDVDVQNGTTICEYLFPELKESEDERIRKELIEHIKANKCADYVLFKKFSPDDVIAWLEKQESVGEIVERCKNSWYNEGKIAGMAEGLTDDEKYQQGWHDALEKQGEKKVSEYDVVKTIKEKIIEYFDNHLIIDKCFSIGGLKDDILKIINEAKFEKQGEQQLTDSKEKLDVLNFIRKETCCGLAEANNALLKLIKVLKEHPLPIMDKPHKLKIEWEEQL